MSIEAVIFDIGNVLLHWQPEVYYDRVIGESKRKELFKLPLHEMNDEIDRGADFKATVYDFAAQHPDWADEIRMWHDNWIELASPAIPKSAVLLRQLKANGVPVFALTNFGIGTFAVAEPVYPILSEFDKRYISGYMKMIKPDAGIYAAVEADCGIAPDRLLFTDDRADNIEAAKARGWQTHLFEHPDGWEACLKSHNLI
jgi:2-haloacid dehalogenase